MTYDVKHKSNMGSLAQFSGNFVTTCNTYCLFS
uniref:Uncharacterized protein n=1 Tax=Anguilla anguilla TaxID=7936 RepID=A0A0E9TN36_ANGAN